MAPSPAVLRVCRHDADLTLQLEGRATMHGRLPIRRVAEQALAAGARRVRVDLRRCLAMDSTVIGTLIYLARAAGQHGVEFALISPSPACRETLAQMGLDPLFPVETADELPAAAWTDVSADRDELAVFQRDVVQAHQTLAALPGPAGETFRAVAECLKRERTDPGA